MTLTFPVLNRCREILWVITGGEKAEMRGGCEQATSPFRPDA